MLQSTSLYLLYWAQYDQKSFFFFSIFTWASFVNKFCLSLFFSVLCVREGERKVTRNLFFVVENSLTHKFCVEKKALSEIKIKFWVTWLHHIEEGVGLTHTHTHTCWWLKNFLLTGERAKKYLIRRKTFCALFLLLERRRKFCLQANKVC